MPGLITLKLSRAESLRSLEKLPRLSPLMLTFLARLTKPQCDVKELTSLVEKDTVLAAQVLQLANSAVFQRIQPIHSVQHAVARIGVGTMRKFALGFSVANLFSRFKTAPSFSFKRFNLHSVGTATLTELLCAEIPVHPSADAFIAGLLHDIGKLLIASNMPQQYEDILSVRAVSGAPLIDCERELLDTDHMELSAMVADRWELDAAIQTVARHHHDPDAALAKEGVVPGKASLTRVVANANAFVNHIGMSVLPPQLQRTDAPSLLIPGFPIPVLRLIDQFEKELRMVTKLFA